MNRHVPGAVAAAMIALAVPGGLTLAPSAAAATVLVSEGTGQQRGNAQNAFNGAFCKTNTCRSISTGPLDVKTSSQQIQQSVDATPGDLILVGYSLGASGTYDRMREWARNPAQAPDPRRIVLIVTYGNPENRFGGDGRNDLGAGLPVQQPYQHLDVTMQYDSVADRPTRFGFYSLINAQFSRHFAYFEDVDINDPDNLVFRDGNATYMLIEADTLPMLKWVQPFVSAQRMAELDAKYRPLVERDYDRPNYIPQGEGADWGNGTRPPSLDDVADASVAGLSRAPSSAPKRGNDVRADTGSADEGDEGAAETDEAAAETDAETDAIEDDSAGSTDPEAGSAAAPGSTTDTDSDAPEGSPSGDSTESADSAAAA